MRFEISRGGSGLTYEIRNIVLIANKLKKNNKDNLYLEPRSIIIDGNNSEGYFEPRIKLAKTS